jgi:uncharacterized membrane protein
MASTTFAASASLTIALLAGCSSQKLDEYDCPPEGTSLTYESFGKSFVNGYCQGCHGSTVTDRQGAPPGYVFDTYEQVLDHKERIFSRAAAGNDSMPPGPDDPSEAEREQLAEWLACGAAE